LHTAADDRRGASTMNAAFDLEKLHDLQDAFRVSIAAGPVASLVIARPP
jgi:hypothetical protein